MGRFVETEDRCQSWLLPESLEDYAADDKPVRVVEAFIGELDLTALGFAGMEPATTGRQAYHPSTLLKIYLYGYLNRIQSSRRLEREAQRNVELMWLTGRLAPDFKTIANFRRDNGAGIRAVCRQFVLLCRNLDMFSQAVVAIDGSKFELPKIDTSGKAKLGLFTKADFVYDAGHDHYTCPAGAHLTKGRTRSDNQGNIDHYRNLTACLGCAFRPRCTPDKVKRVKRWKHEAVLDAMQKRLDLLPDAMGTRRQTVEHVFGTLKSWMGSTHFLTKTLKNVRTEMSLCVLAYNLKRMIRIMGVAPLIRAIRT
jgi:transposase